MIAGVAILIVALVSYLLRAVPLVSLSGTDLPAPAQRGLAAVAPAFIAVIVATTFRLSSFQAVDVAPVIAAGVAFIVGRRTSSLTHSALAGMSCIWIFTLAGLI